MPPSPKAFRSNRRTRGGTPRIVASLAVVALFTLAATPAHAQPSEAGWFHWLSGPLARIVGLFDLEGAYIDPNGRPTQAAGDAPGPTGLFSREGAYIDPNGKPVPTPVPLGVESHNQ